MKKIVSIFLVTFICFLYFQPVSAQNIDIELHSRYAYLFDRETSLVYLDKGSEDKIFPASMTKILTVSLALEKIDNLQQSVTILDADLKDLAQLHATVAGFYAGEKVTYEDLLYGALLPSGADACNALARLTYGSLEGMVDAMNKKVESLSLKNSHFMNVTGLHDEQHYTTVHDMAMILNAALENKEFVKVFETRQHMSSKGNHQWVSSLQRGQDYKNLDTTHIDGGKSGFTDEAQLTFASTMTIDNHQLILVTAYAKGQHTQNHVQDAVNVYEYMNNHFHQVILYKKDEEIQEYWVKKSFQWKYTEKASSNISFLCDQSIDSSSLEITRDIPSILEAPLKEGQTIGHISVKYQNETLYDYSLTASSSIESSLPAVLLYYFIVCGLPVILIMLIIWFIYKRKRGTQQ